MVSVCIQKKKTAFNGRMLTYLDNEKKNTTSIVMCHGNGYSGGCLNYYLKRLGKKYRVLAIDFMNHGDSERDENFTDWSFYAEQVLCVLTHEGLNKVIGVGHSMGAIALIKAAHKKPSQFLSLICLDPTFLNALIILFTRLFGNPYAWKVAKRRQLFKNKKILESIFSKHPLTKDWHSEIRNDYIKSCYKNTKDGMLLCCEPAMEAKNFRTPSYKTIIQASSLQIPLHLIIPEDSTVCSQRMARRVTRKNPAATIVTRTKVGHHFLFEEPEWTLKEIQNTLRLRT